MFRKEDSQYNRGLIGFYSLDELVPKDHLLRHIEEIIDFSFTYNLVDDSYCPDNGRPSLDPVLLIKIPMIQCLFGIRSMRQTIKEIEFNVAYRWFLGLTLEDKVPHFTTYGKNVTRRFQDKKVIEAIFSYIMHLSIDADLIDSSHIFVDGTHIKANANRHNYRRQEIDQQAKFMSEQLEKEIDKDRRLHTSCPRGKKGKLRPKDFIYAEHCDVYLCPENHLLTYRKTTREGYREYKSDSKICLTCPLLVICTDSRNHQKVVTRYVWKDALEICEEIRHQRGMKELYRKRKETIEHLFGTAKEYHNLRYTRQIGKAKRQDKLGLALAYLNLKKYVHIMAKKAFFIWILAPLFSLFHHVSLLKKTKPLEFPF